MYFAAYLFWASESSVLGLVLLGQTSDILDCLLLWFATWVIYSFEQHCCYFYDCCPFVPSLDFCMSFQTPQPPALSPTCSETQSEHSVLVFFLREWLFFSGKIFFEIIYLFNFLAVMGLFSCMWAFSSWGKQGLLFILVHRLLIAVSSLVAEHRL